MNKRWIWFILIIIWCTFIFLQSHKPADLSSEESMWVVRYLNDAFRRFLGEGKVVISEKLVRKSGHFMEYMILGSLLFKGLFRKNQKRRTLGLMGIAGVLYTATDEIHQHFIPGRTMRVFDVMIDSLGLFTGIIIFLLLTKTKYGRKDARHA